MYEVDQSWAQAPLNKLGLSVKLKIRGAQGYKNAFACYYLEHFISFKEDFKVTQFFGKRMNLLKMLFVRLAPGVSLVNWWVHFNPCIVPKKVRTSQGRRKVHAHSHALRRPHALTHATHVHSRTNSNAPTLFPFTLSLPASFFKQKVIDEVTSHIHLLFALMDGCVRRALPFAGIKLCKKRKK